MTASPLPVVSESIERVEGARLDRAADLERFADCAGDLDVEAGERPGVEGEIERRIVVGGEEPDRAHARKIRPFGTQPRIPEARHEGLRGGERHRERKQRAEHRKRRDKEFLP